MNNKGIERKFMLDIIIFVVVLIVIFGALTTIFGKIQGPTKIEILRNKVELANKIKGVTFGASVLPQDHFRCDTERLYWFEDDREGVADKILEKTYATWYGYGEGKIDFVSNWADEYFSRSENAACYVCFVVSNSEEFGPSQEWLNLLINNDKYGDSSFQPIYTYSEDFDPNSDSLERDLIAISDDNVNGLEISSNNLLYIGYSVWKQRSEKSLQTKSGGFVLPSFYRGGFVGVPFALNVQELNQFCKKEIFIDV